MKLTINIDAVLSFSSQKDLIRHAIAEFLQFDDEIIRSDYAKVGTTFGSVELINPDYCESIKTSGWYQVACNGNSWLGSTDYSKYNERWRLAHDGKIQHNEVYGYDQCIEHIAEYYGKQDEYTAGRQKDILTVEFVTKTVKSIPFTMPEPIKNVRGKRLTIAETD